MSPEPLEPAMGRLREGLRAGKRPDPHAVRDLLLLVGRKLEEGPAEVAEGWLRELQEAADLGREPWTRAVGDELALALGEFAQLVDPRFLGLPRYDMGYTLAARGRLEDRLRCAARFGLALPPREADLLLLADRVLATARSGQHGP